MNKIKTLLFLLMLNFGFSIQANADGLINGNSYRLFTELQKAAYIGGINDSLGTLVTWGDLTSPDFLFIYTCTENMTGWQLVAIVNKYLDNNPKHWHLSMGGITFTALMESCRK